MTEFGIATPDGGRACCPRTGSGGGPDLYGMRKSLAKAGLSDVD
jgi:hypothetical protein